MVFSVRIPQCGSDFGTSIILEWQITFHWLTLIFLQVLCLCLCAWMVPLRLLPGIINTALLIRQVRDAGGNVLQCVLLSRELILQDGFVRLSTADVQSRLEQSFARLQININLVRLGGSDKVRIGADSMQSTVMDKYNNVMYQVSRAFRDSWKLVNWCQHNIVMCLFCLHSQGAHGGLILRTVALNQYHRLLCSHILSFISPCAIVQVWTHHPGCIARALQASCSHFEICRGALVKVQIWIYVKYVNSTAQVTAWCVLSHSSCTANFWNFVWLSSHTFDRITTNATLVKFLSSDPDIKFLLEVLQPQIYYFESLLFFYSKRILKPSFCVCMFTGFLLKNNSQDATDGLNMLSKIFQEVITLRLLVYSLSEWGKLKYLILSWWSGTRSYDDRITSTKSVPLHYISSFGVQPQPECTTVLHYWLYLTMSICRLLGFFMLFCSVPQCLLQWTKWKGPDNSSTESQGTSCFVRYPFRSSYLLLQVISQPQSSKV